MQILTTSHIEENHSLITIKSEDNLLTIKIIHNKPCNDQDSMKKKYKRIPPSNGFERFLTTEVSRLSERMNLIIGRSIPRHELVKWKNCELIDE